MSRKGLSKKIRFGILKRDGFRCTYCGAPSGDKALHVDHKYPYILGGSDDPSNLTTACQPCNAGKMTSVLTLEDQQILSLVEEFRGGESIECKRDFVSNITKGIHSVGYDAVKRYLGMAQYLTWYFLGNDSFGPKYKAKIDHDFLVEYRRIYKIHSFPIRHSIFHFCHEQLDYAHKIISDYDETIAGSIIKRSLSYKLSREDSMIPFSSFDQTKLTMDQVEAASRVLIYYIVNRTN